MIENVSHLEKTMSNYNLMIFSYKKIKKLNNLKKV